jgi:hypothetical protein
MARKASIFDFRLNMKHENDNTWFFQVSNPVLQGQNSGALSIKLLCTKIIKNSSQLTNQFHKLIHTIVLKSIKTHR